MPVDGSWLLLRAWSSLASASSAGLLRVTLRCVGRGLGAAMPLSVVSQLGCRLPGMLVLEA